MGIGRGWEEGKPWESQITRVEKQGHIDYKTRLSKEQFKYIVRQTMQQIQWTFSYSDILLKSLDLL